MKLFQLVIWHDVYQHEIIAPKLSRLRSEEEAFDYAEFWIITNPGDIVMLVEVELDICKHCTHPIQEKPGWVMHRWIHIQSQRYMCDFPNYTQAEPKGA